LPAVLTSPCPTTSKKPSKPTLTNVRSVPSMLLTPVLPPLMALKSSSPQQLTTQDHLTPAVSPASNESLAPSCFTDTPSTALFFSLLVLSQRPNPKEPPQQPKPSPSSSTTVPPIQTPPFD
jgi:hypothetical protein